MLLLSRLILPGEPDLLQERPRRGIVIQTRASNDIQNDQSREMSLKDWGEVFDEQKKYSYKYPAAKRLVGPCPVYNCHGLSFACRRSNILPDANLEKIIEDDEYFPITERDKPQPGDIILYYYQDDPGIQHSGIVVGILEMTGSSLNVPLVWSKWGRGYEYLHPYNQCPYHPAIYRYFRLKSWQLHPSEIQMMQNIPLPSQTTHISFSSD